MIKYPEKHSFERIIPFVYSFILLIFNGFSIHI